MNWLSEVKVFLFYKYVVIANMLHIMLWHGNCSNWEGKAAILPGSALQQAFIRTTCHPILKKKQKSHYKKKKKAYVPYIFAYFFFLNKNESSSPQVKHNLTSKFSGTWSEKSEIQHAFTTSIDLAYFVIQTGIQKSNLNKTRLTIIVKKKNTHTQ